MSANESDEGLSMLVCRDTLLDEYEIEIPNNTPTFKSIITSGTCPSKELRMQQQDDESSQEDADDGAVMASVVVDNDNFDAEPAPKKRKSGSSSSKNKSKKKISQDRLEAASEARRMLVDTVPRLPVSVAETHVVRSFGRIYVESSLTDEKESRYSSANALYPIGFSCDRYEFSPVHGRVLKMRCTIFDGKDLKKKQRKHGFTSDFPDGPVFRVMWGQGVDDDAENADYPFDAYTSSAPISTDASLEVAVPFDGKSKRADMEPEEGMRVRVRHDNDVWYTGTIVAVSDYIEVVRNVTTYEITINYDDGAVEDTYFPDPDISIYPPSSEDLATENGIIEVDELRGKPVTSAVGTSPLEAWGKALVKLGLIDEIMLQRACKSLETARVEGREEAKEKMEERKLQRQQARARMQQRQAETTEDGNDVTAKAKESSEAVDTSMVDDLTMREQAPTAEVLMIKEAPTAESVRDSNDTDKRIKVEGDDSKEEDTADNEVVYAVQSSGVDINTEKGSTTADTVLSFVVGNGEELMAKPSKDLKGSDTAETDSEADEAKNGEEEDEPEPASEAEKELRSQLTFLQDELATLQAEGQEASVALADAWISSMGPFLINPFRETESQQSSWLLTVVRKEKSKMGSTGNKKKIVSATDLLERNDSFFNGDIEALVEGLPGSEYCPSYVFKVFRAGGAAAVSQAWVHEAKLRQEREHEKHMKSASHAKAKASELRERELKRKRRDDERDARKKIKEKEEDDKKKARAEERMSRLGVQVDERLFKEACFQREKVILLIARSLAKEFANRRKSAELVAGQAVMDEHARSSPHNSLAHNLPPLARLYDEDVLRIWDFFTVFGKSFVEWGYLPSLPSLDSLQDAINTLRGDNKTKKLRSESVDQLVNLAITLCHPLGASLTKLMFVSLIALNPALQKDFGAAFFAGVNAATNTKDEFFSEAPTSLLPVNKMTWQEIARLSFLSDALAEIGYTRQETAHLLRGYRSVGHPNSKEAKRLRRSEDFFLALLRQDLSQRACLESSTFEEGTGGFKFRLHVPCRPSASANMWIFYLHNVKWLPTESLESTKKNIQKAIALLEKTEPQPTGAKLIVSDLERSLGMLEEIKPSDELSSNDLQICKKARRILFRVLDRESGEVHSSDTIGQIVYKDGISKTDVADPDTDGKSSAKLKFERQRIGLLNTLALSDHEFKQLAHQREAYMAKALRLKEELKEGEVEEDDDDDDDDDGDCNGKEKETKSGNTSEVAKQTSGGNGGHLSNSESGFKNDGQKKAESLNAYDAKIALASSEIVATVVENGVGNPHEIKPDSQKIGKATQYDEFCGDIPNAPDLLRRSLAVLRTLCQSGPAEAFLFPVDPQTNPGYYEIILKPMCLREAGMALRDDIFKYLCESSSRGESENEKEIATIVAQFGRKVRLISQNCSCYVNAGPLIVAAGEEMIRIFERLFFDWVLSPKSHLPPLEFLDDDHCVEFHASDEDALILICDGCEGKYNMSRLDPPLLKVPKGDWFCPRCLRGHCWEDVDDRIGKTVCASSVANGDADPSDSSARGGIVRRCLLGHPEGEKTRATLVYEIEFHDGWRETWPLSRVDKALAESGQTVEPVVCVEAVAESPGYGLGIDRGVLSDLVPVPLNPGVSDTAAQAAVSSSVFRDTLAGSSALRLISPEEMTANEWLRLLVLLITKCSSSEIMQSLASKMESEAAEKMAKQLQENSGRVIQAYEVLPSITDDDQNCKSDVLDVVSEVAVTTGSSDKSTLLVNGEETVMTVKAEAFEELDSTAMVVEAGAIEVVTEMESEPMAIATATASPENSNQDEIPSLDALEKARRDTAIADKEKRQKAREDSIAAFCIKNELHPTVASFEEDVVLQVVDSTLVTDEHGLDFASCRSRGMVCNFCGLSDLALGTPLVRAPSCAEWNELMPHAARSRLTSVLAELPNTKRLATVKIRVGGEIISVKEEEEFFEGSPDGAMMEFLPKNESSFQYELRCRDEAGLPYVTGSLAAHECCAIAAHKTRKERIVKEHAEKEAYLGEWDASMTCGRTLSLGKDAMGRSYWKFNDDSSLFVCADADLRTVNSLSPTWHRFTEPEEIASLMYCLGIDSVGSELKRAFPKAALMLKTGAWSELLLKRRFPMNCTESLAARSPKVSSTNSTKQEIAGEEGDVDEQDPYSEQEDVLVESSCGKLLWDATVVGVSHAKNSDKVNGYRVHYKEWSSRFDEWVDPFRVVEPVENNIEVQAEMLEEVAASRGIPPPLENMTAKNFLHSDDRARGSATLPDFLDISKVAPSASYDERSFGLLKAALILVESALPLGAVDISDQGPWSPALASEWRSVVRSAPGPSSLMRCVILLEECLSLEWIQPQFSHLLACMPIKWKAINEASVSSLAIRIFLIDKGVHYDKVEK